MDDMPDRFCDECGAANAREATVCFACARPLEAPSEGQDESVSDEEVQTSDTPVYLQITLSADSQRTIQFVQPASSPPVPLLHGRYKVLNQVGTGGFGAVYRARDLQANGRMVAIKAIELDTLSASQAIEATDTFNRELNLLSNLDHPHLPTIYEHFIDKNHWYLVMDFIEGEPLDEYLQQIQEPCLPFKQVINVGNQLCDVLRYLHQLHPPVIYRDLKPSNIMRTPGGRLYLIDFGIARRFKPGQTRDTTPLGSPGFAAPEQYGKAQTTPRSDIYSLGATLYFLLTGYDPANTPFHLPPIRSLCPTLPEPLADLLTSMLALDPADRPASIAAVQQVLNEYAPSTRHTTVLAQTRAFAVPPQTAAPPTPPPSHRLRSFLKGIFSIALTCLIVMACTLTAHFMGAASYSQAVSSLQNQPEFPSARSIFRTPYIGKLSSLNPFAAPDAQAADLEGLLFGRLVSLDKYDGVAQGIANSWGFSSDDLHWTFHIDPLAAFSDTSPVTSWDVAASFDYALSAPSAPTACPFFGLIKDADQLQTHRRASLLGDSLTIVDSTTLIVTVARPVPYFLTTLAAPCGSIVASKDLARWGENAFGAEIAHIAFSGVYAVESYNPDQSMTFVYSSFSFPRPSSV
jgi:serine/threonine protein kinase